MTLVKAVVLLVAVLLSACGPSSADPALEVTGFERQPCGATTHEGSEECYLLEVEVVGSEVRDEPGSCELIAFGKDGSELEKGPSVGPIELSPGETFREVVVVPKLSSQELDFWEPHCLPTGEG